MDDKTMLKLIKALTTAKTLFPVVMAAGVLFLFLYGYIRPTGDPLEDDIAVI